VKTAISVPDEVFSLVEERVAQLGVSRSEFYTKAVQFYLDRLDHESLSREIDAALDLEEADDSGPAAVAAAHRRLAEMGEEDW
jgi:metal-responsive CopG/Arc/MetJ family transcriptional regulator